MDQFPGTKIFILAAGFGKRLKPLTDETPKPLIKIKDKTVLALVIEKFLDIGFIEEDIVVNTHYLAEKVEYFMRKSYPGVTISYEAQIRGTGGALFAAMRHFEGSNILIHNSDVLCDEDMRRFLEHALDNRSIATMMLRKDDAAINFGTIVLNSNGDVIDIAGKLGSNTKSNFMFTGIHFLNKKIWKYALEREFCSVWDSFYIPAIKGGERISSFISSAYWNDIGTPARLQEARRKNMVNP